MNSGPKPLLHISVHTTKGLGSRIASGAPVCDGGRDLGTKAAGDGRLMAHQKPAGLVH